MLEKTLNRIMDGAKTPEGKIIAILLTLSLALMTWNATSIKAAFAEDGEDLPAASDVMADETDVAADQAASVQEEPAPVAEEPAAVVEEPVADEAAESEPTADEPTADAPDDTTNIVEPDEATEPSGDEGDKASADSDDKADDKDADKADDKDADKADDKDAEKKEKDEEVKYPEVTFPAKYANGVTVNVSAPEGALPEGTELVVTPVAATAVVDQVNAAVDGEVTANDIQAVDITFMWKDPKTDETAEVQPKKNVSVRLASQKIADANSDLTKDSDIVHIADSGAASVVPAYGTTYNEKVVSTSDFSIYVVVETGDDARLLVHFNNGTEDVASVYVKKNDIAEDRINDILYDPGVGTIPAGALFEGWVDSADYTAETEAMTIDGVRDDVKTKLNAGVTDGDEVTYYAKLIKQYNISYLDENGTSLGTSVLKVRADAGNTTLDYTVNQAYVPDADSNFEGWNVSEGGSNIVGHTEGKVYPNTTPIQVKGSVTFSVNAPKGHWLVFHENGHGATYNAPQFVKSGETTQEPPIAMQRNGYTFDGWYTGAPSETGGDPTGSEFSFGGEIDDTTHIYAKWTAATTAGYTILIWKQSVSDAKNATTKTYDFAEAITDNGRVGQTINTSSASSRTYEGFTFSKADTNVTITPEGTAVANVYFDRNLITLTFQYRQNGRWNTQATMTGLYGQTLESQGYAWPTNRWWYDNYSTAGGYSGAGTRTTYLDAFILTGGKTSQTFYGFAGSGNRTVHFLKKNAGNNNYTEVTSVGTSNGTFYISDKFNGYHAVSYSTNNSTWTALGEKNPTTGYYGSVANYTNLYIRFDPTLYNIVYEDGVYVDRNNAPIAGEESRGMLHEETGVAYDKSLADHNKGGAAYYSPTYDGYVFDGWYADEACQQPYTFNKMTEGITVYAKWRQVYGRVFLHPNAGTDSTLDWGSEDQQMNFLIANGGEVSTPFGTREGYEFVGWFFSDGSFFNTDAFVMSERIMVDYDKADPANYTDPMDKWGNGATYNNDVGRDWVVGKVDLYGKWRAALEGANGIGIIYDATADGKDAPTDPTLYVDSATAIAGAASTPNDKTQKFEYWVLQTWNGSAYEDTETMVLPGEGFTVLKSDAKKAERLDPDTGDPMTDDEGNPLYTYTIQLKAVYGPVDSPEPTHITWHANNGTGDSITEPEGLQINEAVKIRPASTFSYAGYEFIGWAKLSGGEEPASPTDASSLWLVYDSATDSFTCKGEAATQVAADEKLPYDDLYAVWKKTPEVTLSAAKALKNRDWGEGESYTFTLTGSDGAPMPAAGGDTLTFTENGSKDFGKITFSSSVTTQTTYTYTIAEDSDMPDHVTQSGPITATVTFGADGDGDGALDPIVAYNPEDATITNTYTPDPVIVDPDATAAPFGTKKLETTTADGKSQTFTFTLAAVDNAPMPVDETGAAASTTATVSYTAGETGSKPIPFAGTITYTKEGSYEYTITETNPGAGWTFTNGSVTVTVTDNDGQLEASVAGDTITNNYKPSEIVVDPAEKDAEFGIKNVTAASEKAGKTFSFTLAAVTEGAPMPANPKVTLEYAANETGEKAIPFGEITYTELGTYEYTITEAALDNGWSTEDNTIDVTVEVTDNGDGSMSAEVTGGTIANKYAVEELVVDPTEKDAEFGIKNVTAASEKAGKTFNFTLVGLNGAPMPESAAASVTYEAGDTGEQTIPFGKITYKTPGTYNYTITETTPGGGWTAAGNPASVTVKVTDNGNGTMSAEVTTGTISNAYAVNEIVVDPTDTATTFGKKNVTAAAADGKDKTFSFTLEAVTAGAPMPESAAATVTYESGKTGEKTIPFGKITYKAAGDYTYKITEADPGDGWTPSGNGATVTVTITDNGDGSMSASVKTPAEIGNAYAVEELVVDPTEKDAEFGIKNVTAAAADGKDKTFSFTLAAVTEGAPMPESAAATVTYGAGDTGEQTIPFGEITYTEPGEYKYTITEAALDNGWSTDDNTIDVTVEVTDNGDGTMSAEVTGGTIANKYATTPIDVDPTSATAKTEFGKKSVTATTKDGKGKAFSFTLAAATEGAPMPANPTVTLDYAANEVTEKTIPFGGITYTEPGKYEYTITEADPGAGWTPSGNGATVTVTITDNGDGSMSAAVEETAVIGNAYAVEEIVVDPTDGEAGTEFGIKDVTAASEVAGKTFSFTLAAATEGAPMPESATASVTYGAGETGEQTIPFGEITYTEPGTYEYTVTEASPGKGWTATGNGAKVTVKITDNGDGTMSAKAQTATIKNAYKAEPTVVDPTDATAETVFGQKSVTDASGVAKDFEFTLAAVTASAPMPDSATAKVSYAANEKGSKTIPFGEITYTEPGTYEYTITETAPGSGWTVTGNAIKVIVAVTDNGEGQLEATVEGGATITNAYKAKPVDVDPRDPDGNPSTADAFLTKRVTGAGFTTTAITFTLAATSAGAPMPASNTATLNVNAAADYVAPFGIITYDTPGTYTYIVSEPSLGPNWNNGAAASGNVTVTVTDNGEGQLVATVAGATIVNNYASTPIPTPPTPTPTPTPTPAPVIPAAAVPATPAAPAVTPIADNPTPQAQTIEDDGNALGDGGSWSLFDLICTVVATILSIIMLIFALGRNRKEGEENEQTGEQEEDQIFKRKRIARILSIIPAIGSIVLFVLTQDLTQPMAIFDNWSIVFGIIGIINIVLAIATKTTKNDDDEEQQQTPQSGFVPAGPASL